MRKILYTFLFFLIAAASLFSQDSSGKKISIEEKFMISDIRDKLKIITSVKPSEESFELYKNAVEYTVLNSGFYVNDPFFDEIYVRSASGLLDILNSSSNIRRKCGKDEIMNFLNFISEKNDDTLLPHLFRMKNVQYPPDIRKKAEELFYSYKGPFFPAASYIIENNPVQDKLEIYRQAMAGMELSMIEKGELSTTAMKAAFAYKVTDHRETEAVKNILILSVDMIKRLKWSEASPLVLQYFDQLIAYENTDAVKENLKKTIKTLGILGTHEAAVRLSMYIGLINSFAEKGLDYDEEILSEVISSLSMIGDLAAYENLSVMEKLGYSEKIISLSREAVKNLKVSR